MPRIVTLNVHHFRDSQQNFVGPELVEEMARKLGGVEILCLQEVILNAYVDGPGGGPGFRERVLRVVSPLLYEECSKDRRAPVDHSSARAFVETSLAGLGLPTDVECNIYRVPEANIAEISAELRAFHRFMSEDAEMAEAAEQQKRPGGRGAGGSPEQRGQQSRPLELPGRPTQPKQPKQSKAANRPDLSGALRRCAELLYVHLGERSVASEAMDAVLAGEGSVSGDLVLVELTGHAAWAGPGKLADGTVAHAISQRFFMPFAAFSGTSNPVFGNLILSRHPIVQTGVLEFHPQKAPGETPDPWGKRSACLAKIALEEAVLAAAEQAAGGDPDLYASIASALPVPEILVISTHLSDSSEKSRLRQVRRLLDALRDADFSMGMPIFLCGDLNSVTRGDYTDAQWAENDGRRREAKREPASSEVTNLLFSAGFLDTLWQLPNPPAQGAVAPTCPHGTRVDYIYVSDVLHGCSRSARTVRMDNTDHSAYECFVDLSLCM